MDKGILIRAYSLLYSAYKNVLNTQYNCPQCLVQCS